MTKADPADIAIANRLVSDPRYFIERCFSIVNRDSRRVPFLFNPVQVAYHAKRTGRDIVLKARKEGFSSLLMALSLHACLTRMHTRAVLISHEQESSKRLFAKVKDYLDHAEFKVNVKNDSASELTFPDTESRFWIGTAGSRSFGRGDDITHAHLSEAAFYPDPSVITSVQEALTQNATMVIETTANGDGNPFSEMWRKAVDGRSSWKPHFFGWWQDPINEVMGAVPFAPDEDEKRLQEAFNLSWPQLAWRRMKLQEMQDPRLFPQEHPATWQEAFLASGAMLFDWLAIEKNERSARDAKWVGHIVDAGNRVEIKPDAKGPLTIYLSPDDRRRYLIVCDSALGVPGGAFSVADVYDTKSWEQVAQWRGHVDPKEFGNIAMRMGVLYGHALIAVENNYPGNATLQHMAETGYPHIWDEPEEHGDELGFKTTEQSKAQYISDGRMAMKDGSLKINSKATINEMRSFVVFENGKPGPQPGCFQDTVITSCKAANLLKRLSLEEPEMQRVTFRDTMGLRRGRRNQGMGGNYNAGVV